MSERAVPRSSRSLRAAAIVFGGVLLLIVLACKVQASAGDQALADARAAIAKGDVLGGTLAYRTAALSRCPIGCSASPAAFAELDRMAADAELRGDDDTANLILRSMRGAMLATHGASITEERTRVEERLARVAHRIDARAAARGASQTEAASETRMRAALLDSHLPSSSTYAFVALGGLVFLGASFRFANAAKPRWIELGYAALGAVLVALGLLCF